MSWRNLTRLGTIAMVAGYATVCFGPAVFGQDKDWTQVPPPPWSSPPHNNYLDATWVGTASCSVYSYSPSEPAYMGNEFHKWEIIPWVVYTNNTKSMTFYAEQWTANGGGVRQPSGQDVQHWVVNAHGLVPGYLQFWLPPNSSLLNIKRNSAQQTDPNGLTFIETGKTGPVWEIAFPGPVSGGQFQPIVATPGIFGSVIGDSQLDTIGIDISNEPMDGHNHYTCHWDFEYQPLLFTKPPGSLVKPKLP